MPYIGNNLTVQQYSPTIASFTGNGSTTAFTLPIAVVTSAQIIVSVNNVIQNPNYAYTVSGTTLTFTSAPPANSTTPVNIWVEYTSLQTNLIQPGAGTVNTAQFANPPTMPSKGMINASWSTRPSSPSIGQQGYNTTINAIEYWDGFAWIPVYSLPTYSASYLLVAGGGGGGYFRGGGGGAGGMLTGTTTLSTGLTYTVVVGAGGSGVNPGTNGGNSTFTGLTTAVGGGIGGNLFNQAPAATSGGSGGGGGGYPGPYPGGSGTSGQGNAGGTGYTGGEPYGGGGGGGAGAVGGSNVINANGGIGLQSSITGTAIYYAGGGGAGGYNTGGGGVGSGGAGGGGGGSNVNGVNGTSGTANTGGGGGGGPNGAASGGNGGSGIVIISIPTAQYTGITTGSPTITTSGLSTIISFTSSGSYTA
jgi:hypothetical protein